MSILKRINIEAIVVNIKIKSFFGRGKWLTVSSICDSQLLAVAVCLAVKSPFCSAFLHNYFDFFLKTKLEVRIVINCANGILGRILLSTYI